VGIWFFVLDSENRLYLLWHGRLLVVNAMRVSFPLSRARFHLALVPLVVYGSYDLDVERNLHLPMRPNQEYRLCAAEVTRQMQSCLNFDVLRIPGPNLVPLQ
jgi:hypothetical protein